MTDALPLVTVIMPIRNEAAFIARSLGAVLAQDYPPEQVDILIADGMSDDDTLAVIQALPGSARVQIVPNPGRIQAAGLNAAIQQARGDFIVRVDGHTVIAADYVRRCVEALQATGADNVGGAMDPVGSTPMGSAIAIAGKSPFAVPSAFHVSARAQFTDTVYMGAWPRRVFARVGGYNEQVGVNEDYELNYRIRATGGSIYFSPLIRSLYYGRQTLSALARQYYRYGRSKVKTLREHPGSLRPRQVVAPAFVAALVIGLVVWLVTGWAGLWLVALIPYLAVNLAVSMRLAAAQRSPALLWRLPLIFATLHVAWGTGFWVGVVQR